MIENTVENLLKVSKPRTFAKGEYICFEGEPGGEMYIIVQGRVGVYISSILDESTEVAEYGPGEFFGEMALFDKRPRSASCIAKEDVICVAVDRNHLRRFITSCPDIAEKLIINLSTRTREMNDKLYKVASPDTTISFIPFSPPDHQRHDLSEPGHGARYLSPFRTVCPICGKGIIVYHIKAEELGSPQILPSQRRVYRDFDGLWHYIWNCPECGYSNYYMNFLTTPDAMPGELRRVVSSQSLYLKSRPTLTFFDSVLMKYYRAIHFNECLNAENTLLLGKLWLYLSWLYGDCGDEELETLSSQKALEQYQKTYTDNAILLRTDGAKQQCAMILAQLYLKNGDIEEGKTYLYEVAKFSGQTLAQQAYDWIYELRDQK